MDDQFQWRRAFIGAVIVGVFILVGGITGLLTGLDSIMGIVIAVLCVLVGGVIGGVSHSEVTYGGD